MTEDNKSLEKEVKVTKSENVTKKEREISTQLDNSRRHKLMILVALLVILIIVLIFAAGSLMRRATNENLGTNDVRSDYSMMRDGYFGRHYFSTNSGQYVNTQVTNDTVTTTVYNYMRGVVVDVNKDNIIIAGSGRRTTINIDKSTEYTDNVKPVVDDTVVITGTTSNDKITASRIEVTN